MKEKFIANGVSQHLIQEQVKFKYSTNNFQAKQKEHRQKDTVRWSYPKPFHWNKKLHRTFLYCSLMPQPLVHWNRINHSLPLFHSGAYWIFNTKWNCSDLIPEQTDILKHRLSYHRQMAWSLNHWLNRMPMCSTVLRVSISECWPHWGKRQRNSHFMNDGKIQVTKSQVFFRIWHF